MLVHSVVDPEADNLGYLEHHLEYADEPAADGWGRPFRDVLRDYEGGCTDSEACLAITDIANDG